MKERARVATSSSGRSYELVSEIGRGGFGSVWRARLSSNAGFSKEVAIKLMNAGTTDNAEFGQRFRDEARILALLRHRAIVAVDDLARIGDQWGVVMEYIEGVDLHGLLELGPVPPRPAIEIVGEVASALRVAHEAKDPSTGQPLGLVHRDIKPSNIRVSTMGEVKVLDFGVARAEFTQREAKTRSVSFGSDGYMAPERMELIDTQSADIYALGVVLWECLTDQQLGQLPVEPRRHKAAVDAAIKHLHDNVGGRAVAGVGALLRQMIAYYPEERPSAARVEDELQSLLELAEGPWLKRWAADTVRFAIDRQGASSSGAVASAPGTAPSLAVAREPASEQVSAAGAAGRSSSKARWISALLLLAGIGAVGIGAGLSVLIARVQQDEAPTSPAPPVEVPPAPSAPAAVAAPPEVTPPVQVAAPTEATATTTPPAETQRPSASRQVVTPTGTVKVQGEVQAVSLISSTGKSWRPGSVPVGVYDLVVTFPSGRVVTREGLVRVVEGDTVLVRCDASVENCR